MSDELKQLNPADLGKWLRRQDLTLTKAALTEVSNADIVDAFAELGAPEQALLFRLLPKERGIAVFETLEPYEQQEVLRGLQDDEVTALVEELAPDDRVRLFDELPAKVAARLLQQLTPEQRTHTSVVMGYPPGTAGRIMTPEYVTLRQHSTVQQALDRVRQVGMTKETVYTLYVTDSERHLVGIVSLRDLVMAEPDERVEEMMERDIVVAHTEEDQEAVARDLDEHSLLAIPVLDKEDRLVGIVTVDDAIDVLEQETTEDFQRLMAITEAPEGSSDRYFRLPLHKRVKRRLPWLTFLALSGLVSGSLLAGFQETLSAVIALSFFLPMIMGTAGNTGSQSATLVVRALATEELELKNLVKALLGELATGLLLGVALGVVAFGVAWVMTGQVALGLAVALAIVGVVIASGLIGTAMPFLMTLLRVDPAVASTPFISTVGDVVSLTIYLFAAKYLYHLF